MTYHAIHVRNKNLHTLLEVELVEVLGEDCPCDLTLVMNLSDPVISTKKNFSSRV